MAFQNKNLSVIAYANGFTLWHYGTQDKSSDIMSDGYFNDIRTLINAGDIVIANTADDTRLVKVTRVSGGVCTKAMTK
jgi:hypothetical protein